MEGEKVKAISYVVFRFLRPQLKQTVVEEVFTSFA